MADLNAIVDSLSSLTIMEAAELAKLLEEKWGVSAAAPMAVAAASPAEAAVEEKDEFDVILISSGDKKIQVIKEVRALTSLGLKEAKDLVESAPKAIKEGGGDYEYRVGKNSVLRRAAADSDVAHVIDRFEGPTAVAISYGDAVGLAKILVDFAKEYEVFELKAGVLDGSAIEPEEIGTLATLPPLDELRGRLIGVIQASAGKLARLVSEPGAQLARVVAARGRQET